MIMITLTKGYKQGRAVMFYDAFDELKQKHYTKVPKDDVVKFCSNGLISNAKVQWWQGKAIVRLSNNIPLVKLTQDGLEENVNKSTRSKSLSALAETKSAEPAVAHTGTKRKKRISETDYSSYMIEDIQKKQELKSTVSFSGIITISELFDTIANDFRLRNTDKYKQSFASKIDINKKLSDMSPDYKATLIDNIAVYLMNMANIEIRDVYIKYSNVD